MTLKEFMESYEGFDFDNCETVIINQRTGFSIILTKNKHYELIESYQHSLELPVYNWTHTSKTMLITL